METKTIVLSVLLFLIFGLFNFFGFVLIERLLKGKKNNRWVYVLLAAINGVCSYILMTNQRLWVTYFVALIIMTIEIILVFDAGAASVMYGTMAILINSMCLHGMVAAVTAWICWVPMSELSSSLILRLYVPTITSILDVIIVLLILKFAPLNRVIAAIKLPKQKSFMLVWMSICMAFMFGNFAIYTLDVAAKVVYINELLFCLALLVSCYFMLFNSLRVNQSMKILMANRQLSSELGNQKLLQSAFLKDSVFYIEVNLSKNRILSGSEKYMESFGNSNFDYSLWFQKLETQVHEDDREYFKKLVNRDNLLELAETGVEPPPFIYRRNDGEKFCWIKMNIRLFHNEETGETMGFGYSFDVDADINREKELLEKSKTDGFTGLLNKATTQSMIREQVRHGTGALFLMDIDNFKQVNDTMGHEVGDQILKFVANTFKASFSGADIVGRVGGDEFMAFCADDKTVRDVTVRAEALLCALADESNPARPGYEFSASLGVTLINKLTPGLLLGLSSSGFGALRC